MRGAHDAIARIFHCTAVASQLPVTTFCLLCESDLAIGGRHCLLRHQVVASEPCTPPSISLSLNSNVISLTLPPQSLNRTRKLVHWYCLDSTALDSWMSYYSLSVFLSLLFSLSLSLFLSPSLASPLLAESSDHSVSPFTGYCFSAASGWHRSRSFP